MTGDQGGDWRPISEMTEDGRQVLMVCAVGPLVAPAFVPTEPPRDFHVKYYRQYGEWPQDKFTPKFYAEIPPWEHLFAPPGRTPDDE